MWLLAPGLTDSHRTWGRGSHVLRGGTQWGSCLVSISRRIYFQHAQILPLPWECQRCRALPTLHCCPGQPVSRVCSHSASSLLTMLCFAFSCSGVQPCRDGNIGRKLTEARSISFPFFHQGIVASSSGSFLSQEQIPLWLLQTFLQEYYSYASKLNVSRNLGQLAWDCLCL